MRMVQRMDVRVKRASVVYLGMKKGRLRKWMLHIEVLKKRVVDWKIRHMLREGNREADLLANEGVGREVDLIEFYHHM
ncbi:Uncharacterized protein TCM_022552 [Theobroma cacao]|uniref:RNase H type-1 domain-containing protein n=1 Tax=Theobroma cacao TaxID=3641 RepID=A0A061F145_THECC|nr:Uncharacterized protein TCM_022552 [Theobroma cacao]